MTTTPVRWLPWIGLWALAGCPDVGSGPAPDPAPKTPAASASAEGDAADEAKAPPTPNPSTPAADLGRVLDDAPLPLAKILGAAPPEAESHLGPPQGKGGTRGSCVRFVPERTFFTCKHAWQRYDDRTGTFGTIEVLYEDGAAASLVFEGLPEGGEFTPTEALRRVGLALPGEPTKTEPNDEVTRWSWFNAQARLLIDRRQYRVEVSNIGGSWAKTRVDLVLNDPLTDDQRARVVQPSPGDDADAG